jgi:hypothetical protein
VFGAVFKAGDGKATKSEKEMRFFLISCALALTSVSAIGAEGSYKLFPVAAVFSTSSNDPGDSKIDSDFSAAVSGEDGGKYFDESFRAAFPGSVANIDNANKRRTFVVSLQIARASKYVVGKPDGTDDVYLPLTGSIYFTNVITGEVLYTLTKTEIKFATVTHEASANGSRRVQALFRENFEELVSTLIKEAVGQFHPSIISAVVRSEWKGLAILDGGREQGISREDTLVDPQGNELLVVSAGPTYSIGKMQLGVISRGSTFSRVSNQTLAEIRRPRVLPIVENAPRDFPEQTLVQLLSDSLGAKSAISLIPVNRTYQSVLTTVASKIDISQEKIRQRELPNFFFRLNIPEPIAYEVPTNLDYKTRRVYEAIAIAQMVDRSGRVLYSGIGRNRIEDEVTSGIAFNDSARKEVVIKNALIDLANRFGSEMKFSDAELAVKTGGKEITLQDDLGMLSKGASWRVYRSIGKQDGINGDVRVPTWDISVTEVSSGQANAILDLPIVDGAPEPAIGDVVFLNGVTGSGLVTRKRFGPCPEQKLGAIGIPGYGELAQSVFASNFKAPYFSRGLGVKISELVSAGSGFKSDLAVTDVPVDYCVEPAYRVDTGEAKCSGDACGDVATIRLTYRIRIGVAAGEIKVRQGLESKLTAGMLPKATPLAARASALQADMRDELLKLNSSIVSGLLKEVY